MLRDPLTLLTLDSVGSLFTNFAGLVPGVPKIAHLCIDGLHSLKPLGWAIKDLRLPSEAWAERTRLRSNPYETGRMRKCLSLLFTRWVLPLRFGWD